MIQEELAQLFKKAGHEEPKVIQEALFRLVNRPEFDGVFYYEGPLGPQYRPQATDFYIWAPTAMQVDVLLFEEWNQGEYDRVRLKREERGVYHTTVNGDLGGKAYVFELCFPDGTKHYSTDPYAKASTLDSERSVVVNPEETNVLGWETDERPPFLDPTQAVIYETNVRDLTSDKTSGAKHPGKFIALTYTTTMSPGGKPTGLAYLADLGVTHVQFMPIFDYFTVKENIQDKNNYNWGYDPQNYNVPEGSLARDPMNPYARIRELKQMIHAFHQQGLRVVMDVVYNHVYDTELHPLNLTVPGYYFRYTDNGTFTNGSGVGNDTASERLMMRRYIIDSLAFWAKNYHIDGFRVDLMGIHDIETMNQARWMLDQIDENLLLYGEGWNLNTALPDSRKAAFYNANKMPGIGFFNDNYRDALRGSDWGEGLDVGFISGKWLMEQSVVHNFLGGENLPSNITTATSPLQLIQYVEAHDNWTLWDKLRRTNSDEAVGKRKRRQLLANAMVALTQGIPFFHQGQEFFDTKAGVRDSYRAGDVINSVDWQLRDENQAAVTYFKELLKFRRQTQVFHLADYETIRSAFRIHKADYQIVAVEYHYQEEHYFVVFNGQDNAIDIPLPAGGWRVLARDNRFLADDEMDIRSGNSLHVEWLSTMILVAQ
ncbi:MAG: type I pullulanase [Aerococcus sp.]|nr:type I pullulanase [Aerococcus sp.]